MRGLILAGSAAAVLLLSGVPLCPFAALTGIPCPGCGLTRATVALLSGDLSAAVHFHPLVPVVLPALALFFGIGLMRERLPLRIALNAVRILPRLAGVLVVALFAVWVTRFFGAFGGPVPIEGAIFDVLGR